MTQHLLRDHAATSEGSEATLLVEGRTAEEALEKVHRDVGEDARIIQAEKVRRGGVGGFFAREMVQLTVASEQDADTGMAEPLFAQPPTPAPAPPAPAAVASAPPAPASEPEDALDPVLRMAAAADADEMTFGEALRSALGTATPQEDGAAPTAGVALPEIITGAVPEITTVEPAPEVIAAPSTPAGATGPSTPRRAHWATAASRAGMRSLAVGAEALATTRVEAQTDVVEEATVASRPVTIDLDVLGATALAPTPVEPTPRTPTPTPPPPAPTAAAAAAPRPTTAPAPAAPTPRWSRDRLLRAGLSDGLVDEVMAAAPSDDLAWMHALARAVEPVVRPAPEGDCIYVGGRVERHAKGTGAALCRPTDTTVPAGSLAMARRPGGAVREWLDTTAGDRWLHLVVGGEGWREWLWEEPAAISWATPEDLPVALGIARSLGLPLVGTVDVDGEVVASAVDIAMAIRTMLERP